MRLFKHQYRVLIIFAVLAGSWLHVGPAWGRQDDRAVLILHSYHKAAWTDSLFEGIRSVLGGVPDLELVVEYMDTKRLKTKDYFRALDEIYRLKYSRVRFDSVLTSDDNAYRYALAHQNDLFKDAPIVFCGVNRFDPREIENRPQVTGVVEKGDFLDTLGFAIKVHPAAGAIHVILDQTNTGQINKQGLMAVLRQHYPDLKIRFLIGLSLADLSDRLAALPASDFAFFISYWQDGTGKPVSPDQLSTAFYKSAVPIYGRSEWMLNKGLTGGKCVSGFHQGQAAAQLVKRILEGRDPSTLPVNRNSPNRFMFDYRLLQRYGIALSALPPESILFNKPEPSFYDKHRKLIWTVLTILVLLVALVLNLGLNINRRKMTEKDLRASETRFRTLVENAADAIFLSDAKGNIVDVNRLACKSLGYTRQELLDRRITDIDANFFTRESLQRISADLQPGRPIAIESAHRSKDGSVFPVMLRIALLEIDSKRFILGLAHDITERKQMEAELRESEARYRQLVQCAPAGIYKLDLKRMRFSGVNDVMCEYTGYTQAEFLRLDPLDFLSQVSAFKFKQRLKNLTPDNPTPPPVEYCITGKNGRLSWVLVNSRFVFDKGIPVSATCVVNDITALHQAEAQKKELEAKLVQIQKMESLGTLAGGIAHDFNNLLMGIQGNASLMLLDDERVGEDNERLNNIERYVQRGVELTRQLLGLARGGKYEVKPTDLNRLVYESAGMFNRTKKEIRIHHHQQDGVWSVVCDQGQIHQVLLNIFVNAGQAMHGGGDLTITTENTVLDNNFVQPHSVPAGRYVKISIADTGAGIAPEIISRIFDPFFTTKERSHGTGLGLASAYGIIKNHDGIIDVASRLGKGSTFNIYLPAVDKAVRDGPAKAVRLLQGSERILLVDDETMVLNVGQKMLEKLGYKVLPAASGAEALDIYRKSGAAIDLVVLDMIMPDMSGATAFTQLKEIDSAVRVLLSSGYSINDQAAKILEQGCRGFIQKPFNILELSQKIREVLA